LSPIGLYEIYSIFATCTFVLSAHIIGVLKSRKIRWAGHVACTGDREGVYMVLIRRPERKTLERPRYKWDDNIRRICKTWTVVVNV
jgi:hypothetical protein